MQSAFFLHATVLFGVGDVCGVPFVCFDLLFAVSLCQDAVVLGKKYEEVFCSEIPTNSAISLTEALLFASMDLAMLNLFCMLISSK